MTNVGTVTTGDTEKPLSQIVQVNVTKAKNSVEVETDKIGEEQWAHVIHEGLKARVNSGMSKITAANISDESARKAEALRIAKANVEAMYAGTLKAPGRAAASKGTPGVVMTEARRLARGIIHDQMKAAGLKRSHYDPKQITAVANEMLKDATSGPGLIAQAEKNLAARGKLPGVVSTDTAPDQIKSALAGMGLKEDPTLAAKADAEAAARKSKKDLPISAKQAGMTAARAQASSTAH